MVLSNRDKEAGLLLIALVIVASAFILVYLADQESFSIPSDIYRISGLLALMFFSSNLAIRLLAPKSTPALLPITAFLSGLGTAMIYRLNLEKATLQFLWIGVGISALIMTLLLFQNYEKLRTYKYIWGATSLFLLLSPIFWGVARGGSRLWLDFGFFKFQPAEIAKILLVVFLAAYLGEKRELLTISTKKVLGVGLPSPKYLGPLLFMWAISLVILIFERDLGSSLLFFGIFLSMIYVATGRSIYAVTGVFLFLVGAVTCYFVFSHVQTRIDIWIDPWSDWAGSGYQVVQSLFALASGGLSGSGLSQGYPRLIPAVETDFIFSAMGEELGLFGGVALILSYILFIYQGLKVALNTQEEFGKLLATGLVSIMALQTFVIIGGATKLVPLTGVTLPFLSYGGSSILSNFILLGLLLAISNKSRSGLVVP